MNIDIKQIGDRALGGTEMFLKRHGPALLTTAGVAGFMATTFLTGRAVLRSQDKIKQFKIKNEEIYEKKVTDKYTQNMKAREMGDLWLKGGFEILKIYSPVIVVGSASIFCFIASHEISHKKQTALLAAYTALDAGYKTYRKRVEEEVGPEREIQLYRGTRVIQRELEGTEERDDLPACVIDYDRKMPSPYAKFFDEFNVYWSKTPEYNLQFLRGQQAYANNRLQSHGFVFLNEIYEALGFRREQKGQHVGWMKNADRNGTGDGFIDFGIYNIYDESSRAFVNGLEGSVLLDFNVDGIITIPE